MSQPFIPSSGVSPLDVPVLDAPNRHPVDNNGGQVIDNSSNISSSDSSVESNPNFGTINGGDSLNNQFDNFNSSGWFTPVLTLDKWLEQHGIPAFAPDPNASPSDNLAALNSWVAQVFSLYNYSGDLNSLNYANILGYVLTSINRSKNEFLKDLSDSASLELAEKFTDQMFSFINAQYQSALSYQSWYLQQEYNSPLEQINRLTEAGLHTAFALGSVNSGNAGQSASVPTVQQPQQSNAGQAQQQSESSWLGFLGQGLSAAASFIPAVGPAVSSVMSAAFQQFVGKKMLPYNIAKAGVELVNMGQSYLNLQDTNDQIKANTAIAEFNVERDAVDVDMRLAKQEVDTAKENLDYLHANFSEEYEELGFETDVITKEGKHEKRWLSVDETNAVRAGKTTLSDGSVVAGITSLEKLRESNINLNAGLDLPFAGKVGVSGGAHASDKSTSSNSDTRSKSKSNEVSNSDSQLKRNEEWSDDGSSFRIENAKFTSVTKRTRLPLPAYAEKFKAAQKAYESQLDRYETLSTFNKARLNLAADKLTRNLARLSRGAVKASFKSVLDKYLNPESEVNTLIGD